MKADDLFVALDGRSLTSGGDRYRVEVYSVRDEAGGRWVQLALVGASSRLMLTVRAKPDESAQHVIMTLSSWLANPAASTDVINTA